MKKETKLWLEYAEENYRSALVLLESQLYNPCLQNIQQSIEKYLKALIVENKCRLDKTHSISKLINELKKSNIDFSIDEDDIDLIDTIYMPSKYPLGSALPDFDPDEKICKKCLSILEQVKEEVISFI